MLQSLYRMPQFKHASSFYCVALLAVLVYVNTLIGDFTFDDNFAVISNGDVTNDGNPVRDLFKHDFWGQDITSAQSHKSYRPITILAFRWTRQAWRWVTLLAPGIDALLPVPPALPQQRQQQQQHDAFGGKSPRPTGLHPFPFHVLSVVLHAAASMLVLALAQHLFAKLEQTATAAVCDGLASAAAHSQNSSSNVFGRLLMWDSQPGLWLTPASQKGQQQALIAALLFALHPVHTEAVAGVVGCAEPICAVWSIPALLLYFMAVDGRYAAASPLQHICTAAASEQSSRQVQKSSSRQPVSNSTSKGRQQRGKASASGAAATTAGDDSSSALLQLRIADALQHWLLVVAAAVLALLAALSKEIGITITGTMVLYDLLLAPHMQQHAAEGSSSKGSSQGSSSSSSQQQQQLRAKACRRQVLRILLLAATTVGYIRLRQWVAVQQLVAIYRKVENPIPFASSFLTRVMTTGYLHARYFGLLLLPVHLSADWSFSCIPLVEQLSDTRNLATAALYVYFLYVGLSGGPVRLLQQLWGVARATRPGAAAAAAGAGNQQEAAASPASVRKGSSEANGSSSTAAAAAAGVSGSSRLGHARWRLMVVVGLLIAPFFPASNVLFYVGTFIGERLLYFPSIGFCLLLADVLGTLLPVAQQQQQQPGQGKRAQPTEKAQPTETQLSQDAANTPTQQLHHPAQHKTAAAEGRAAAAPCDSQQSALGKNGSSNRGSGRRTTAGSVVAWLVLLVVLVGYGGRTVRRNVDWWDEERLFLAAEQVCPNSAKVQQNCGVLQRRYQNFEGALKHFKRAQEIEPGYCEPSYWIALTTINQGDVLRGLNAMKASLACKFTASDALQTLNRLYIMMHDNAPTDPMPLVDWAGVLASSNVLRVADACATAEDAALLAASVGKSHNYIEQALDVCLRGIHTWEEGGEQPDTLAGLARIKYASLNTTLLRECVQIRRVVYKKLSSNAPKSKPVRQVVYRYINKVQQKQPGCRSLAGGGNAPMDGQDAAHIPSSHQKLLHRVQSADPEDPWLQLEWGQTLIALGGDAALKDAARHLEVASAIFNRIQQQLQDSTKPATPARGAGDGTTGSSNKPSSKTKSKKSGSGSGSDSVGPVATGLDGKTPLTVETALEASMLPLEWFRAAAVNSSQPVVKAAYCDMLKRLCHLRLQMVVLVQQQQQSAAAAAAAAGEAAGSGSGSGSVTAGLRQVSSMKVVLNAKAAGRRCLVELSERRGCEQQAEEIRRLVGRGTD